MISNFTRFLLVISFYVPFSILAQDCEPPSAIINFEANKVRSKLSHGGSLWWNKNFAGFAVPKDNNPQFDVNTFYAAGIWIGGLDPGGNLKLAGATYGQASGKVDYWPGPLNANGGTGAVDCYNWDRFFRTTKDEIDLHQTNLQEMANGNLNYTKDLIPESIKAWPANGNPYFEEENGFSLPSDNLNFTDFYDANGNGTYEPLEGDYPALIPASCGIAVVPDEMIYWVFNDNGSVHEETNGDAIGAEFHALAFAFETGGALDYTQFYRYKLVNKATEDITDSRIGLWIDPDLGCPVDDYIGCDTARSLMYVYNKDNEDDFVCPGINSYGQVIPIAGVDFLGIQRDEQFPAIRPMDVFSIYNTSSINDPAPRQAVQFYNLLNGRKADGQVFQNPNNEPVRFNYYDPPNCEDADCWSMCKENTPQGDFRTIQATGQFTLKPFETIELYFANVFVPNQTYPCPDLTEFFEVDNIVQEAYDNCFQSLSPVKESVSYFDINVFPNPVHKGTKSVRIDGVKGGDVIMIYDLQGKMVYKSGQVLNGNTTLNLENIHLNPGLYLLHIKRNKFSIAVEKLVFLD
ncbi:MAG: T9SS type A sorting domain-containing protein [Saprospiraceae bacterium]